MEIIDANTLYGVWPKDKRDISLDQLLRIMRENNVAKALSTSMKGVLYDYEEGNAETLKASKENSQIIPVATCDLRRYYGKKKIAGDLRDKGFKAVRLFPDLQRWPLDYAPFYEILRDLNESGLPLIIPVSGYGKITKLLNLTKDINIPIVLTSVDHWNSSEALLALKNQKNLYVETSHMNAPDSIEVFTREIGAEHLVFGSYSPFHPFRTSYRCLEMADISDGERKLIAGGNIKRGLKL